MMEYFAIFFLTVGVLFLLLGSIGVIRFPDFYTRTHAMSKPDTLGLILSLSGIAILNGWNLTSLKLILVVFFVALANSSSTHALGRAALKTGLKPWFRGEKQV
jgi:multicomponent Na+:H+ antiporter subunit G